MATTVVNLRHETYDVYVGRAGKGQGGTFGNPYTVQEYAERALPMFEAYFKERIGVDPAFREAVLALKDKRLGCFCRPKSGFRGKYRCHAQFLAAWLDGVRPEDVP